MNIEIIQYWNFYEYWNSLNLVNQIYWNSLQMWDIKIDMLLCGKKHEHAMNQNTPLFLIKFISAT